MLNIALYKLGLLVHWLPREYALVEALKSIQADKSSNACRVVDMGAGFGQLSRPTQQMGFTYLGLEPDADMRREAQRIYPSAEFIDLSAIEIRRILRPGDILVLNGVVHHICDYDLSIVLDAAQYCSALIICDHHRIETELSFISRWLQAHDKGRYIRNSSFFTQFAGLERRTFDTFTISVWGVVLWPYFCALYTPLRVAANGLGKPEMTAI